MITFLPYPDFVETAQCLDYKRLGKQRVEAMQIINLLLGNTDTHYKNHPAVKMWNGYVYLLICYTDAICDEWLARGYKDTCQEKIDGIWRTYIRSKSPGEVSELIDCGWPWWLGNEEVHDSHKSNLLRKLPEHYGKFSWNVPDNLEYAWPVR